MTGAAGSGRKPLKFINDDTEFFPHQIDGVRWLANRTSFLLADEMGGGKAQPNHTPVMTPDGPVAIGMLEPGHVICRPSGGTQTVSAVHPRGTIGIAAVHFADGTSTQCSWDHLWMVSEQNQPWKVMSTRDLHATGLAAEDGGPLFQIPLTRPTTGWGYDDKLTVDPYSLGFAFGGGFINAKDRTTKLPLAPGTTDAARLCNFDNMRIVLTYPSDEITNPDGGFLEPTVQGATKVLMKNLAQLGVTSHLRDRFIPPEILEAHWSVRWHFFLGMLGSSLTINNATSNRLGLSLSQYMSTGAMDQVKDLIRSLGGIAIGRGNVIAFWWTKTIRLWNGTRISSPSPARYITGIFPAGTADCTCITVDDEEGLYLTNDYIVTHNSLQALTVAAIDFERLEAKRVLIVCPSTVKDNWAAEIAKFTTFKATVLPNTAKAKRETMLRSFMMKDDREIMIVNYEQVNGHLDKLNGIMFDIVIFDEAHAMKSPGAQRTKACHKLNAPRSFVLTGSPMLNRPDELWGLLHRINPVEFPSYWRFRNRYCKMGGFKGKQVVGVNPTYKIELLEILDRYMLRRMKADMVELPEKMHVPVIVPMSKLQADLYREAEDELKIDLPTGETLELENAMVKMLRLKQITGTPFAIGHEDSSGKLDRAIEIIQQLIDTEEKVVVWTQFRGVLEALMLRLAKLDIPATQLHGDVPVGDRVARVADWTNDPEAGVLASMLQIGGVGLNFTAASNEIFLDKLYVPLLNDQAEDRCHRLGMGSEKVTIWWMLCKGTVEERVEKILAQKRKLGKEIIDPSDYKKLVLRALHEED